MVDVSDEVLMAYIDGELDEAASVDVANAISVDVGLMARAQRFRATRAPIQRAFDGVLREPIPRHLIDLVRGEMVERREQDKPEQRASIVPFAPRARPRQGGERRVSKITRMAASVALLSLAGATGWLMYLSMAGGRTEPQIALQEGESPWMRVLQTALETASSGASVAIAAPDRAGGSVRVVATFRSRDQRYCRQYSVELAGSNAFDGLACRTAPSGWLVEHQMRRVPQSDGRPGLRPAAGRVRQALDAAVDELIDGGVLDPAEERKVLESRWVASPGRH